MLARKVGIQGVVRFTAETMISRTSGQPVGVGLQVRERASRLDPVGANCCDKRAKNPLLGLTCVFME
jgi:hypothetical protein